MNSVRLSVAPVPRWVDAARLLGVDALPARAPVGDDHERLTVALTPTDAAGVAARLRGVGIDGRALEIVVEPGLGRPLVRAARLRDARLRRALTPGFTRPGTRAEGEGRYSLTPESLALAIGRRAQGAAVIDACCGSGGNAIGFARAGCRVTAIERDAERLAEARHNAAVYGVSERITFVHGDALSELPRRAADLLFVDPPWGLDYDKQRTERASFPLFDRLLAERDAGACGALWAKVPSSFAVATVPGARPSAWFGEAAGDAHRIKFVLLELGQLP